MLLVDRRRPWGPDVNISGCCWRWCDVFFDGPPPPNVDSIVDGGFSSLGSSCGSAIFLEAEDEDEPVLCFLLGSCGVGAPPRLS